MSSLESYRHVRDFEADFDRAQGAFRRIASIWILAGFGALGFLFSAELQIQQHTELNPSPAFYAVFVCGAASIGLYLLWYIDQNVYQKLLHSVFVYGYAMEQANPNLPQIRSTLYASNLNISSKLGKFYKIPISVFYGALLLSLTVSFSNEVVPSINSYEFELLEIFYIIYYIIFAGMPIYFFYRIKSAEKKGNDLLQYYGHIFDEGTRNKLKLKRERERGVR